MSPKYREKLRQVQTPFDPDVLQIRDSAGGTWIGNLVQRTLGFVQGWDRGTSRLIRASAFGSLRVESLRETGRWFDSALGASAIGPAWTLLVTVVAPYAITINIRTTAAQVQFSYDGGATWSTSVEINAGGAWDFYLTCQDVRIGGIGAAADFCVVWWCDRP